MSLINIYSLPKKRSKREEKRIEIYENVLKMCHKKIKLNSEIENGETYLFYTIPSIILGFPIFDQYSCCDYICNKLSQNGFKIVNVGNNMIFISWGHISFDEDKEKELEMKIDILNGNTDRIPLLKDKDENKTVYQREFRPVYDIPSTEQFLSN